MYFVERENIENTLLYYNGLLEVFEQQEAVSFLEKLGIERLAQMVVESIIDVGNLMIDGFIMRDPGSYEDIIDILVDERVIPKEHEAAYKEVVSLRPKLVREYTKINHAEIETTLKNNLDTIEHFRPLVLNYLENELGPINAFHKPKE
ncbi:DUF86 domain-containing protein [Allobacillus sp. SKP8-2]|uniref:DUF86 domain-containing protein n=2 Tax=Bacillaceae TaxID=186817 RepID=A0A941CTD1_9BACI|nr:DUF86 domain-containing protein [Allobacillus saliphilus]MBR7553573.1 DUF86 domain-containing protein [Allobacillus saliphilus]